MIEEYIVEVTPSSEVLTKSVLIRCRDCKHRKRQFGQDVYCQLVSNVMPPDGYCSMAEANGPIILED